MEKKWQERTAAEKLAQWVSRLKYEDLSPEVVFHAKRCMLDTLGVQLRGAALPWVQPVYQYARSIGGSGLATVSYHGDRLATPYAAYANSTFSCSCELQHHGAPESAHPGVTVIPAVQALAEQLGSSSKEIITAMVAGYDVQGRLATELFKPAFEQFFNAKLRHFHPEGLFGVFSGAAAAAKLLPACIICSTRLPGNTAPAKIGWRNSHRLRNSCPYYKKYNRDLHLLIHATGSRTIARWIWPP